MMEINQAYIETLLEQARAAGIREQEAALKQAEAIPEQLNGVKLSDRDIALLLQIRRPDLLTRLFAAAGAVKDRIYGRRVVLFAPLYVSNYCVNRCVYCGFKQSNALARRRLSFQEIQDEVQVLERMGHKRLALEAGEDPQHCDIQYILSCLDAIYSTKLDNGSIRRVNVNIAATTVDEYRLLHEKGIGTYILFQETYHQPTYAAMHPSCRKSDYNYHLTAFDRAMQAGIDDVGAGVLFGLADPEFEVLGLLLHNNYLDRTYGTGFHTISMPRLRPAEGMELAAFPHLVDDRTFERLVAIIRLAVPYTGIIMSTRESAAMRDRLLRHGVSQVSAGSNTDIGGYKKDAEQPRVPAGGQFELSDERRPDQMITALIEQGYIPSYCTACYRQGRTGDRFMQLAKTGAIHNVCTPNALLTLQEYLLDYGDPSLRQLGASLLEKECAALENAPVRQALKQKLHRLKAGERDLYF